MIPPWNNRAQGKLIQLKYPDQGHRFVSIAMILAVLVLAALAWFMLTGCSSSAHVEQPLMACDFNEYNLSFFNSVVAGSCKPKDKAAQIFVSSGTSMGTAAVEAGAIVGRLVPKETAPPMCFDTNHKPVPCPTEVPVR